MAIFIAVGVKVYYGGSESLKLDILIFSTY